MRVGARLIFLRCSASFDFAALQQLCSRLARFFFKRRCSAERCLYSFGLGLVDFVVAPISRVRHMSTDFTFSSPAHYFRGSLFSLRFDGSVKRSSLTWPSRPTSRWRCSHGTYAACRWTWTPRFPIIIFSSWVTFTAQPLLSFRRFASCVTFTLCSTSCTCFHGAHSPHALSSLATGKS